MNNNTTARTPEELLGLWSDIRVMIDSIENDLKKNVSKNNISAGKRVRSTLRYVKKMIAELNKELMTLERNGE